MQQRELKIASNMLALAKRKKGKNKRSMMLRTIMPFLSRETGDQLADAIDRNDSTKFTNVWNKVRGEITTKLSHNHRAHASAESGIDGQAVEIHEEPENFRGIYSEFEREFKKLMDGTREEKVE